jgi:hypothetical protein
MFNRLNNLFTNAWIYKNYIKNFYYDFAKLLVPLNNYDEESMIRTLIYTVHRKLATYTKRDLTHNCRDLLEHLRIILAFYSREV